MDESVVQSMAKWPDVPAVFGWLSLDRRGDWRIKQQRISHTGLSEFIGRNYQVDAAGRWYFQNGPQRVYVRIEGLPHVLRLQDTGQEAKLFTHTGCPVEDITQAWMDEQGSFILGFARTAGLLCDRDIAGFLGLLVDARGAPVDDARIDASLAASGRGEDPELWLRFRGCDHRIRACMTADLAAMFGFVADPRPAPGHPDC